MKLLSMILISVFIVACSKHETKYLISKYDPEYQALRAFAVKKCQNESPIFKELQKSNIMENWQERFKGQIYRSVEKAEGEITKTRYFKVLKIEGENMEIILNSSVAGENKVIVFHREEDGVNILKEVSQGVCNEPEPYYTHSSLNDKTMLRFTQVRQLGTDQNYNKILEEFYLRVDMPLVLFNWSGKVVTEEVMGDEKITKTYNRDLSIVKDNMCPVNDELCLNFPNPNSLERCDVAVTQNAGQNDDDVELSLIGLNCSK